MTLDLNYETTKINQYNWSIAQNPITKESVAPNPAYGICNVANLSDLVALAYLFANMFVFSDQG